MKATLQEMRRRLTPIYGEGEAKAVIRAIFHALKGWGATEMVIHEGDDLSPYMREKIEEILKRLEAGEPVQYVVGEAYFYGMDLHVRPGVLIPRPETAELVDMVVADCQESDLRVLDVGTGSGAIAIALARNLKFPQVTALDVSPAALDIARENARMLKARIEFVEADVFGWNPVADSFDIIVSNPPYVLESEKKDMADNVLLHEPEEALFVPDADPLRFYNRIARIGREGLAGGGRLYFEINPLCADDLKKMLEEEGYVEVELEKDIHGRMRYARCRKPDHV